MLVIGQITIGGNHDTAPSPMITTVPAVDEYDDVTLAKRIRGTYLGTFRESL
jgi:hypothetical protein